MKTILHIASLLVVISTSIFAQQIPLGNLYNSNEFLINSAESAADTVPVIFLTHRKQWIGTQGEYTTPRTSMLLSSPSSSENNVIIPFPDSLENIEKEPSIDRLSF